MGLILSAAQILQCHAQRSKLRQLSRSKVRLNHARPLRNEPDKGCGVLPVRAGKQALPASGSHFLPPDDKNGMRAAYASDWETKVLGAEGIELTVLLYEGAVQAIHRARHCLAGQDIPGYTRQLGRVQAILLELTAALDHEAGADIAANLDALYEYMQHLAVQALATPAPRPLNEVESLLSTLLEGWRGCLPHSLDVVAV